MAEKLKDLFFQTSFFETFAQEISNVYSEFNKSKFMDLVLDNNWEQKELKEKMRHVTECLYLTLPEDYPTALEILKKVAPGIRGFEGMVFPDFVECYGMDHWDISLPALREFNQCCSSEFAIRLFIKKDQKKAMNHMYLWAEDEEPHVRRLASEGCRPRLPWAMALPALKNDPSPILPILEKLKSDESESVRRSVANNLNDISKDNPQVTLDICERWYDESENVNKIVKHACRGLLKSGNKRAMLLFGFADPQNLHIKNFKFDQDRLSIGDDIKFSFDLQVKTQKACKVRLEYIVYFVKANGKLSNKVFQIKEMEYKPGVFGISKKHSFQDQSTRKHYPGEHFISIIVNGVEKAKKIINLEDMNAKTK